MKVFSVLFLESTIVDEGISLKEQCLCNQFIYYNQSYFIQFSLLTVTLSFHYVVYGVKF
jgi:hypothetical protein